MELYLLGDFGFGMQRRKGVMKGLSEKFHSAGLGKSVKPLHDFRSVGFKLFDGRTSDRECDPEPTLVAYDQVKQKAVHRYVTVFRDAFDKTGIQVVIEIRSVGIEDSIFAKPKRLVDLKIQADSGHER